MAQNSNAPSMRVRLMKDGKVVRSFKIKPDTFTIGSGQEATVRIGGVPDLATKHALIWLDEGRPTLVPSSGCTVLVNGTAVKHAQIQPNDIVSLGRLDLQVESLVLGGAQPSPAPPQPQEEENEMEAEETQVSSMPYHAPPAAPPPRPAAPPRLAAEALPPFDDDDEDEDQATMVAAPQELARLREQSTSEYSVPPQAQEQPQPPAQPSYFTEDETTLPAKPMPSPQALARSQKYEEMELTEEERAALADLLPFATPVPAQMPGSYNDPGLDDYMSAPSPIENGRGNSGLSWETEAPAEQSPMPPSRPQYERPAQRYEPPAQPQYEQPAHDPYEQQAHDPYEQPARDPYEQRRRDPYGQPDPYEKPARDPYEQPARDPYEQRRHDPYGQPDPYEQQPAPAPPRAAPPGLERPEASPHPPHAAPYESAEPPQSSIASSQPAEAAAPYAPPPRREQLAPPSERADSYDDDDYYFDDDEDDEFDFVEPFSLIEHLATVPLTSTEGKRESYIAAEVFRHSEGRLWDMVLVRPGKKYRSGPGRSKFLKMEKTGQCVVNVPEHATGTIWIGGTEADLSTRPPGSDGMRRITLSEGDRALLRTDESEHLINVVKPPKKSKPSLKYALVSLGVVTSFIAGVAGALIVAIALMAAFAQETPSEQAYAEEEHFEEISQNDLALLAAQELDTPEVEEEEPEPEEEEAQPVEEIEPQKRVRMSRRRSRASGGGTATNRLLKALRTGGGGGGAALNEVITNIDSVGSPNASSSLFRSTGIFGAMPGGKVQFARRGTSGGVNTVGGNALKAGNPGLGAIKGKGGKRGKVRGRVSRVSSQARVNGSLDRSEVLRVINSRMGAITRCYEKRLMANPGLSGRLVFAWTVSPSGGVGGVSVRSSTMGDPAVASCISGVIRRMRFPRPTGGSVQVSFPFLFRAVDI